MASAYLYRTLGTPTNANKGTVSHWVKRSNVGASTQYGTFAAWNNGGAAADRGHCNIYDDTIYFYNQQTSTTVQTNRKFRDVNGWYHWVIAWDTTQATASDRVKIYVNGVQETSFGTSNYPGQNNTMEFNVSGRRFGVGCVASNGNAGYFWDGQMAHFHFVDGTAYTPTTFGETDATTGIWKPKASPTGITYGNNGFFLKFDNSGNMGLDSSGNSNNLTTSGTIIQNKDTPNNVFCTMNELDNYWQASTFANTNNTITTSAAKENYNTSTLAMSSNDAGKYYCEVKIVSASAYSLVGLADKLTTSATSNFKNHAYGYAYDSYSGNILNNGGSSSYGNSYTTGDIIGIAVDTDNNKLYFSKNGTWQNSGDPTSGSTGTGAISISATTTNGYYMFASGTRHNDSLQASWNFGNGYFGTTAVTSAQNPDDGIGIFEYDVPAGYRALCTKSLNAQEYS